jgi:hypothetical protein
MKQCPIDNQLIDSTSSRITAGIVTALLLISASAGLIINLSIFLFLAIDFYLRAFRNSKLSLIGNLSRKFRDLLKIKTVMINAGPKKFAAKIGFIFSTMLLIYSVTDLVMLKSVFLIFFASCTFLESAFSFCVGCKMYEISTDLGFIKSSKSSVKINRLK